MDYLEFETRAHEMFESIPREYREGVDGLMVERATVEHPTLPEIFTMGECRSEYYPSDYGGPGEVLSIVVLFYGSFLELSRRQDDFDWEEELWETITHEVRHHLESLAAEDALEVQDYAEDQNFARREGEPFEPFFFRSGEPLAEGVYQIDRDLFVEMPLASEEFGAMERIELAWGGATWSAPRPATLGDVHFVALTEMRAGDESAAVAADTGDRHADGDLEVHAVLVRRRGALGWLRGIFGGGPLEVLETRGAEPC